MRVLLYAVAVLFGLAMRISIAQEAITAEAQQRGDSPAPLELLRRCVQFQSQTDTSQFTVSVRSTFEGTIADDSRGSSERAYLIRRDGSLIDAAGTVRWDVNTSRDESYHHRVIANDSLYLIYQSRADAPAKGGVVSRRPEAHYAGLLQAQWYGFVLDGYAAAAEGKRLTELLLSLPDVTFEKTESAEGEAEVGVTGTSPHGLIEVTLDAQGRMAGYRFIKEGGDTWHSQTTVATAEPSALLDTATGESVEGQLQKWEAVLEKVQYDDPNAGDVATSGVMTQTWTFEDGVQMTQVYKIHRSAIELNPSFENSNAFVPDTLPNGAKLTDIEMSPADLGGIYTWQDGHLKMEFADQVRVLQKTKDVVATNFVKLVAVSVILLALILVSHWVYKARQ